MDVTNPLGEDQLPSGPKRDLVLALHGLHSGAGRPPLREIEARVKADGRGTASHATIGEMLSGCRFPRWSKFDVVVRALAAWPGQGLDPETEAQRFNLGLSHKTMRLAKGCAKPAGKHRISP
jgi:hypothetical protein